MSKEMKFFIYLIERYAEYKGITAQQIMELWDRLELSETIYDLYEMYHIEAIENAFADIDALVAESVKRRIAIRKDNDNV